MQVAVDAVVLREERESKGCVQPQAEPGRNKSERERERARQKEETM